MTLTLGALGVVFGDIGTSPLYTLRACMHAVGGARATTADLLGVLSLIFWSLTLVVTVKYLLFVMRVTNHGEGGMFALLAMLPRKLRTRAQNQSPADVSAEAGKPAKPEVRLTWVAVLVVIGAALLYGDGAITPAISVLSAVEGLAVAYPAFEPAIVPLTCGILIGVFALQRRGTGSIGRLFGPLMVLWFTTISALGLYHLVQRPDVLQALSPLHALHLFTSHGPESILVLGSVVLAVTGAEALYADMGHFGPRPIRAGWLGFVMPSLVLCYFGQGALLLRDPRAVDNPFFAMVPAGPATLALVVLASASTVVASQALISGAFSLTRQAMQLGYFPRVTIRHTAHSVEGQIYVPQVNWLLAIVCLLLVLGFKRSEHLAAAYGLAVTGTMVITSIVYYVVIRRAWGWSLAKALHVLLLFLSFDLPLLLANVLKIADGGWVPVLIASALAAAMLVWSRGRSLMVEQYAERYSSVDDSLPVLKDLLYTRVPGPAAVFMASSKTHMPPILMHFVKHIRVLPETVVLLTVITEATPSVPIERRFDLEDLGHGIYRLIARYGFMEQPRVPNLIRMAAQRYDIGLDPKTVTYYLGRDTLLATKDGQMGPLSESLFSFLSRNAVAADRHFGIPPRQVVEIGLQVDL